MSDSIDISGLDKAEVLAALYNKSKVQGLGFLKPSPDMTKQMAELEIEKQGTYFDYLHGRVMKVEIGDDTLDPWLYDRDNGDGAAYRALKSAGLIVQP